MKAQVLRVLLLMVVLFAMVDISYATGPVSGTPITTVSIAQRGCGIATIPISVTQFSNIASVSLTLYYNPNFLIYDSATVANMPLNWTFSFGTASTSNPNQRKLIMGAFWDGTNVWNMGDQGEIILAYFHTPGYTNGSDTSSLRWDLADVGACEYGSAIGSGGIPPYVLQQNSYNYVNGLFSPISGFPSLTCPGNITQWHDPGVCSAVVNWMNNVSQALPSSAGSGNASTTASFIWQSFTAESSGILTGIGLTAYDAVYANPQNGIWTYKIFKGEGVAGCLLYSGTYNATSKSVDGDTILLRIPKPLGLYVTQGDKYTFQILGGCPVGCSWPGDICVDLLAYYNTGWHSTNGLYLDNTGNCQNTASIIVRYPVDDISVLYTTFIDVIPSSSSMAVSDGSNSTGIKYLATPDPSGSVFPHGPTTVTYTATDYAGHIATCAFTVTITGPSITSVTGAARCGPGVVNLSAVASPVTATIRWYSDLTGGTLLNTGTTYSPSITATTTYYLDATDVGDNGGCTSTPRVPVTATMNPFPAPAITGPTIVCATSSANYSTPFVTGDTYTWTVTGGSVTAGGGTSSVTVVWGSGSSGTVSVIETTPANCSVTASVNVTINALPVVSNVTMQAREGETGGWTYPVNNNYPNFQMCLNSAIPWYYLDINTLTPSTGSLQTNYLNPFTLTGNYPGLIAWFATQGIGPASTGWQGEMYLIITGGAPMFYIYYTGTDYQLIDGLEYWMGQQQNQLVLDPLRVNGTYYPGTYTYSGTVKDVNGCYSNSMSVNITLNTDPILVITNPAPVCYPGTVNLSAPAVTAGSTLFGATLSYWVNAGATQPLVNYTAVGVSGTYYIKATTEAGCTNIMPVVVTISPVAVGGTITPAQTIVCLLGNTGTLTLSGNTGTVVTWQRSIDNGTTWTDIPGTAGLTSYNYISINHNTMYRAIIQSGACSANAISSIATVYSGVVTTAGSSTVCAGSDVYVPVTVMSFTDVQAISLTLKYDQTKLTYVDASYNPLLTAWGLTPVNVVGGTVYIGGYGSSALSLADNTVLFTLHFHLMATFMGGTTSLTWYDPASDQGIDCEYATTMPILTYPYFQIVPFCDTPTGEYYYNSTITVNSSPLVTISGITPVCIGYTGDVFTTQSGQTNYTWVVTGGNITGGGSTSSNTVTVDWPTAGNWSVTVNYTDANGCRALSPVVKPVTVNPLPVMSDAVLEYSTNPTGGWVPMSEPSALHYQMCLDPLEEFYYLNALSVTENPAMAPNLLNGFKLNINPSNLPPSWNAYWIARGVTVNATPGSWQAYMYQIIIAAQPMFYINYTGTAYELIDGLQYQMSGGTVLNPLRVNGDYPAWNYIFGGTVQDVNGCVSSFFDVFMQFNTIPSVSLVAVNPTCPGVNNGSITATPSGGTPTSYSFSWNTNPVQTTATAINLGPGTYTVTVTDGAGCTVTGMATLVLQDQPAPVVDPSSGSSTVACESAVTTPTPPVVHDACGNLITPTGPVIVTNMNGCQGTIAYTYTYTDYQPKSTHWTYTYTITPPVVYFLPVSDITVPCGAATTSSLAYTNGLTGICAINGSVTSTLSDQNPAGVCGGDITESWTYTDFCNRIINASRTIHVSSATLPTMTVPENITVACGNIPGPSTLQFSNNREGNCNISGTSNPSTLWTVPGLLIIPGACGGIATETWTATDACNRPLVSVSRTITVLPATLPTMTAPSDITVACSGEPAASTLPFSNGLSGNCHISGTSNASTLSTLPGACGGNITETWTATDECSRILTPVTRTITVSPATLPVMTPLSNTTVACGTAMTPTTVPYTNSLQEGCLITGTSAASTFSGQVPSGACGGNITETWRATDACGRILAPVTRTITVSPATLPTMIPLLNTTVACGQIPASSTLTYDNSLGDGCHITGTSNGSTFSATPSACGGTVTETWTATDACGRALAPVTRTITVSPATLPVMTAPDNITVACGGIPVPGTLPFSNSLSDGCLISGTSNPSTLGTTGMTATPGICGGNLTETWTATDACGRALVPVSRTITVLPAALPTMTPLANITVACGGVPAPSTIPYSNGLTYGCQITGTSNASTFTTIPGACGGTVTETWSATDACLRALASVSRTITVLPATLPTMTAPSDITVACGGEPAASTLPFSNGIEGNCHISGTSNASTLSTIPNACGGTVTETWTATDACLRALTSVSRTITVNPATLPTMTAPANVTVACGGEPAASTLSFTNQLPTGMPTGCVISGTSDFSTFTATPGACGGNITETWTATDQCNRALVQVSRTITVSPATLPTMTAPGNITVACGGEPVASTLPFSNSLEGNCNISGTSNLSTLSTIPNACGGTVTETWSATDACLRALTSVSRTITVLPAALPTMTPLLNTTVACGQIPASSTLTYDNSLGEGCHITGTSNGSTFSATPSACGGTVTETWTATDQCLRALVPVSRTITVSPATLPTMTAPSDITVACGGEPAASTLPFSNGIEGNCHISGTSNASTLSTIPDACGGTVTETWTATDACQRALTSVSRIITVSPATLPTMTAPVDITVACGGEPAPSTLPFSNGIEGNCNISGTSNPSTLWTSGLLIIPGACGGTATETWTATDVCGRILAPVTRTITVSPATLPTMTPLSNITVACGSIPASSTIPFSNGLSDGCQITGTSNASTFTATPGVCGGTVTETWTATDECQRTLASVSRIIHVSPATTPWFPAQQAITVACGGATTSNLAYDNGLTGNCELTGTVTSALSTIPGACGGDVTETWTATVCGNIITTSRIIHVSPATAPTFASVQDITVLCGQATTSSLGYNNGLATPCNISGTVTSSLSAQVPAGSCGGDITETWTATPCTGMTINKSRIIHVSPATAPTFASVQDITVLCGQATTSSLGYDNGLATPCNISGTATSNLSAQVPAGSCGGDITETWTATPCTGMTITKSRIIHVSPATTPWFPVQQAITVSCGAETTSNLTYNNGLTGNCQLTGTVTSTLSTIPGACGGDVTETWTTTVCGNIITTSRIIHVSPATTPWFPVQQPIMVSCGGTTTSNLTYDNGLTGNCELTGTVTSALSTIPNACGGNVTETWTATPCTGMTITTSRTITVLPAALPTMTAPANVTVACGSEPAASTLSFTNQLPTGMPTGCLISGTSNVSTFTATPGACGGIVTETWTATDQCNRPLAPVSRTITVSPATLPTMTAPSDITVACGGEPAASTLPFSNGLGGGCLISGTSNLSTLSTIPNACGGTVTETWTATDQCSRALVSVSRTITVSPATLPTMTAPGNITVACGAEPLASTLTYDNALTGNCHITGTSNASTLSTIPDACGGTVTETWTATDACQRALTSVSRTITVSPATLPTMTPPSNTTVACGSEPAASTLPFSNGLTGNCNISGTSNASTLSTIPGVCGGTVTETWTATDACSRPLASVSRTIIVSPAALPTMTALSNITVTCINLIPAASTITYSNGLSGSCLMTGTSNSSSFVTNVPGSCNGQVTETWTATDACSRTIVPVSRIITINDNIAPVISQCASDQTVYIGSNCLGIIPDMRSLVTATDNCSATVTINQAPAPGSTYGVGDVTVTFTAEDACSNLSASCTATVHILSNTVSGSLTYNNSVNTPLNGVVLSLMNGNTTLGTATTANGAWSFTGLCASSVTNPYTVVINSNPYSVGGVNSTDAGQANYWWTHTPNPIQKVRFLSGDVMGTGPGNPNYIINSIDALNIQLFFVNNGNHAFDRSPWSYFPDGAYVTSNTDPNRLGSAISVTTTPGTTTLNLLAECTGDFNMSYIPGNSKEASAFELVYSGTQQGDTNESIGLPIHMVNPMPVSAISMVLNFPTDLVNITDVTMNTSTGTLDWSVNGNELRIGWFSTVPFNVDVLGDLLTLKLKTTAAFTSGKSIRVTLVSTSLNEIADANYNVIPDATVSVAVIENSPAGINPLANQDMTFQNHPNPFANLTTFTYNLPVAGNATIEIHDLLGRVVMTVLNEQQISGPHILQVDATTLPMGIYIATLKLANNDGVEARTIKIVETK